MKKKIIIISILIIILISIISVIVYIQVQNKTNELATLDKDISTEEKVEETKDENIVTNEEVIENTEDNNEELTNEEQNIETKGETEITQVAQETKDKSNQETTKQSTNEKTNTETQKTNSQSSVTNSGTQQPQTTTNEEPVNTEPEKEPEKETVKIDLSKYSRYESALNGGYKAYMKSDSEMSKLRNLIDTCINEFGYTNVKVVPSSSIVGSTQSFTANKTNVENKVYNSEYFTIYYYAEAEYHITANGDETIFQYKSYIKVQ